MNVAIAFIPPSLLNLPPKIKRLVFRGLEPLSDVIAMANRHLLLRLKRLPSITDAGYALLRIDYPFED